PGYVEDKHDAKDGQGHRGAPVAQPQKRERRWPFDQTTAVDLIHNCPPGRAAARQFVPILCPAGPDGHDRLTPSSDRLESSGPRCTVRDPLPGGEAAADLRLAREP